MEQNFSMITGNYRDDNANDYDSIIPGFASENASFQFRYDPFFHGTPFPDQEFIFQENSSLACQDYNYEDDDNIFKVTLVQANPNPPQMQEESVNPKVDEMNFLKTISNKIQENEKEDISFAVFTPPSGQFKELMYPENTGNGNAEVKSFQSKLKEADNLIYRRKFKPDDVRKKVKVNFHKTLRKRINQKLKEAGSKKFFNAINQTFICNISKAFNKEVMDKTLNQLYLIKFQCRKASDHSKFYQNLETLEYIQNNSDLEKNSGYDVIGKLTYRQLFEEYLRSEEFGECLEEISKKEQSFYLDRYRELSRDYLEFFDRDKE